MANRYTRQGWGDGTGQSLYPGLPNMDTGIIDGSLVDTIADLKTLVPGGLTDGEARTVLSHSTPNDGGHATFRYSASSSATNNDGTIVAPNTGTGRWLRQTGGAPLNARWFGAKGDNSNNDTTAIQNALNAASPGGDVVVPAGTYRIASNIQVPDGVNLLGEGNGYTSPATRFLCTAAGARISWGAIDTDTRGGVSGNFKIDGNNVATNPMYIAQAVQRTFMSIDVNNAAAGSAGILIEQAQNCLFMAVNSELNAGDGIRFDRGCGGLDFVRCEFDLNGAYNARFTQTTTEAVVYTVPSHIQFYGCLFERRLNASTIGMVLIEAGTNINFYQCVFADSGATSATNLVRCQLNSYNQTWGITFYNPTFQGNQTYVTGVSVGVSAVVSVRDPLVESLLNQMSLVDGATIDWVAGPIPPNNVQNEFGGAGNNDAYVRYRLRSPLEVTRRTVANQIMTGFIAGEAGQRMAMWNYGMGWGSGADFAQDVRLERSVAGQLDLIGNLKINAGTPIVKHLSATTTWDPASVAAGTQHAIQTMTVTGAALGDTVVVSFNQDLQGMQLTGYVSAANTVSVILRNGTAGAINLASGTLRADVWGH